MALAPSWVGKNMKLDVTMMRYLTSDDFRLLTAVELGSKSHEVVPTELVASISRVKGGGIFKTLMQLMKYKLVSRVMNTSYDGFRLTYGGFDFLALQGLAKRESVKGIGRQIGVGKESDIYLVTGGDNSEERVIKLQRLGRTSFRTVKNNRDYHGRRQHASWQDLSRLAATKEFAFMKVLHANGFPIPRPYDHNRHVIVMEKIDGDLLANVGTVENPGKLYEELMNLILRLANVGLIHGDFNEFNLLLTHTNKSAANEEHAVLIDFPQMLSTAHPNAQFYFERDVECIRVFFERRFGFVAESVPSFDRDVRREGCLDIEVAAAGFTREMQLQLEQENGDGDINVGGDQDDAIGVGEASALEHDYAGEDVAGNSLSEPSSNSESEEEHVSQNPDLLPAKQQRKDCSRHRQRRPKFAIPRPNNNKPRGARAKAQVESSYYD